MRPSVFVVFAALFALGCSTEPEPIVDPPADLPILPQALVQRSFPTGSTTLVARGEHLWNVNTDAGTVSRSRADGQGDVASFPIGEEPTRIAVHGDRLFVTLRGERAVAEISASAPELGVVRVAHVGAEPYGVVVRQDGLRVYVALSQEDAVVELDGDTLQELRRFPVDGEPRYLALHPSGATLYVGSGRGEARLTAISVADGAVATVPMPATRRMATNGEIPLVPRITGDLWVGPDGDELLVPVLYGDNVTPIREVSSGEIDPTAPVPVEPQEPGTEGYGGSGDGVDKFTPAVVEVPISARGTPGSESRAVFVSTSVFAPNSMMGIQTVGSYVSSVSASPDGTRWLATMQASSAALLIDPSMPVFGGGMMFDGDAATDPAFVGGNGEGPIFTMPEEGGFQPVAMISTVVGAGADGAVFDAQGRAHVNNAFEGSVDLIRLEEAEARVVENGMMGMNMPEFVPRGARTTVSTSPLPANVRQGRELFFSAMESSMGQGGISCSTCHFEGRNDGITWTFESGVRQTPSLAGVVSETAPVTWTSDVESVAMEADLTSRARMGGTGLSTTQLDAIAAYVDWTREVDVALKGETSASITRGRAIFERADVGCASCHSGDRLTDNAGHTIRGVENLNTPGLRGIAATAPYLHDGSAPNLRTVLEWARGGVMGDTSSLSSAEMDDLEAYLRSL